ncbi:CDP-alcohol phosphatidyltransferase family protein [Halosegnis longus]|uniref:CDP-alcohol phosphatidyltransferase family protein n=1 Tax=Halosegnis longus TaxID=2216012 RepID=A0AAJ4R869_9EURY|nr:MULTISPECIES: CDP-alcohol phosphatidyltransferase family protein [Halobacteriales]RNJ26037.1 CDP-alcohol phosphatidyltransferase family protein [Salella cibi]
MTLDQYRSVSDRLLAPVVRVAIRLGLTPNAISVVAIATAGAAGAAYWLAAPGSLLYLLGAFLVLANGLLDVLDGMVARQTETDSPGGDLIDHVLDRYADILLLVGLAGGTGEFAIGLAAVTGVLMTSYLGTQAQAVGLDRVYGGLVGRADRLAIIGIVTGLAAFTTVSYQGLSLVGLLLVFFAVIGHVTALQRFYYALRALE